MSNEKPELSKIDLKRLKREAKRLRDTSNIPLCKAQNEIALDFGCQTFESLRSAVMAARKASSTNCPVLDDPGLEDLLAWFRSHYTRINDYEARVSPMIADSLRQYERINGKSALQSVDVGDEIDFRYDYEPFRINRHPRALAAQNILEDEGKWVANSFLDSLKIRKGGLWGDGPDQVVGDRLTIAAFDEGQDVSSAT